MLKRITGIILAVVIILSCTVSLSGCSAESSNYPVTVAGLLIEKKPQFIVCLSNKFTQIIVDMGYTHLLSGRSAECTIPEVQTINAFGTAARPSADLLATYGCDLLIVDTTSPVDELQAVHDLGIPILQLYTPSDRLGFINLYRCIGAAMEGRVDGYNTGNDLATEILIQLDDVQRAVSAEEAVTVCIYTDSSLTKAVTGDMLGNMLIELAGGFNVAVEGKWGSISLDNVAKGNPDVILCCVGDETTVLSKRVLQYSGALENNKIYGYNSDKLGTLGFELVEAAWELARLLHPDLVDPSMLPGNAVDYIPDYSDVVIDGGQAYLDYAEEQARLEEERKKREQENAS